MHFDFQQLHRGTGIYTPSSTPVFGFFCFERVASILVRLAMAVAVAAYLWLWSKL